MEIGVDDMNIELKYMCVVGSVGFYGNIWWWVVRDVGCMEVSKR